MHPRFWGLLANVRDGILSFVFFGCIEENKSEREYSFMNNPVLQVSEG